VTHPTPLDPFASLTDQAESWPVDSSGDLHRDDWVVALRRDTIRTPDGEEGFSRLVLEHPGAVIVLALDDQERVCLLSQYRHPAQRRFVELPAGLLDGEGETPLDVARRELAEEAGLAAEEWTHVSSTYSSPGISTEVMHLFVARGLSRVDSGFEPEHEEAEMALGWASYADVHDAVVGGRLTDGPLVQLVLLARARGLVGGGEG
jgi:8-oxo-dGTP pyrophosphatase MutT (NUDIX family)